MAYPTGEQYSQALQNHALHLVDEELRRGEVEQTKLGLPRAIDGGFALTYTIQSGEQSYAVRCFKRETKFLTKRYKEIAKKLSEIKSPYFVDFEYQEAGIKIGGSSYPIVKMNWAHGELLGSFIERYRESPTHLLRLDEAMLGLSEYLESEGIAHGDIQLKNIVVSGEGTIVRLIDYDGMYIKDLDKFASSESGYPNFQHPQRQKAAVYGSHVDRFSFIAVHLALKALSVDPLIWAETDSDEDIKLVFEAKDYAKPKSSQTLQRLAAYPELAEDVEKFSRVCQNIIDKAPTLSDFILGRNILGFTPKVSYDSTSPRRYVSPWPVITKFDPEELGKHNNSVVEFIGQVVSVQFSETRLGDPLVHLVFASSKSYISRISVWPHILGSLSRLPDQSWVNQWVAVTGKLESHFSRATYMTSFLLVPKAGMINVLSKAEVDWRSGLGLSMKGEKGAQNEGILSMIRSMQAREVRREPNLNSADAKKVTRNQSILDQIKGRS